MEITIIQSVLIGLWTAFCYSGLLFGIYTNRAIVLSFGVGVILGDIATALQVGAIAELAFMGFGVGAGGTVPPNPIGPGIIGTIMAITIPGVTPESALALSIPFAIAIQFLQTGIYIVRAGAPEGAVNALRDKNMMKFKYHSNMSVVLFAVVGFALGFLGGFSIDLLTTLVGFIPNWLLKGLSTAGGLLPAIGFAMIMSVMLKKELLPYVFLGYVFSAYIGLPVMGVALLAAVFAIKHFNDESKKPLMQERGVEENDWI